MIESSGRNTMPVLNANKAFYSHGYADEEFLNPSSISSGSTYISNHPTNYTGTFISSEDGRAHADNIQPLSHHLTLLASNHAQDNSHSESLQPKFPPQFIDIPDIRDSEQFLNSQLININNFSYHHNNNVFSHPHLIKSNSNVNVIYDNYNQSHYPSHFGVPIKSSITNNQMASPPSSNNNSPIRESSEDSSDDSLPLSQLALKRSSTVAGNTEPTAIKKPKTPKKRKKKDPNEPQKPVSAYALFFRDTQATIKEQNKNASFGEVSKLVASMWDSVDEDQKNEYKKKTEVAKKEYLKQLAAYRASLVSKQPAENIYPDTNQANVQGVMTQATMGMSSPLSPENNNGQINSMHPYSPAEGDMHINMPGMQVQMNSPQMNSPQMNSPQMNSPQMNSPHMNPSPNTSMSVAMVTNQTSPPYLNSQAHQHMTAMPQSPLQSLNAGSPSMSPLQQMNTQSAMQYNENVPSMIHAQHSSRCKRTGCSNIAIENPTWDNDYCSNQCVVTHCRDVFNQWVENSNNYASVK